MIVFRVYLKIFYKNIVSIIITFICFLIICLLFIGTNPKETYEFEPTKIYAALINHDEESEIIAGFTEYLSNYANYKNIEEKHIEDALYYREIYLAVIIPKNFTKNFLMGEEVNLIEKSIPDASQTITAKRAINKYFNTVRIYLNNTEENITDIVSYVKADLEKAIEVEKIIHDNDTTLDTTYYFNYLSYLFVAVIFTVIGVVMINFRKEQIRQRIAVSPISQTKLNLRLVLCHLLFTLVLVTIMISISYIYYFDSMNNKRGILYIINAFCLSLSVLSMGYMFSLFIKKNSTLGAFVNVMALATSFICGAFVPQNLLSKGILKIAHIFPNYYYITNNNYIGFLDELNSKAMSNIYLYILIQLLFAVGFMTISIFISKKQMTSEA
ncbi:MAG: ABC transporter permease [Bacilli bacterium]|nr:ABC transporter permease [Bacilli bacterium]